MPKSKEKTKSKCDFCFNYEKKPLWGHQLCSAHRECAQGTQWEPTRCVDCRTQKAKLVKMPQGVGSDKFFRDLYLMLYHSTQYKIKAGQNEWLYDKGMSDLFGTMDIPPMSHFSSPPVIDDNRKSHSDGGASY